MKHAGRWFLALVIVILLLAMFACKPAQQVAQSDTTERVVIKEVLRDTTVYLTDSAGLYALLYCDSMGKARIRQIEQFYAGQFIKPKVIIKDNYLTVDCKIDSAAVMIRWTETHTDSSQTTKQIIIEKVNYVTGLQWFQIYLARIALAAGVVYGLYMIIKNTNWITIIVAFVVGQLKKLFKKSG